MQHLVNPAEVEFSAIRAQGPGGQNVNKVSSAIHLRFPIAASSLPEAYKERLLALRDSRISKDGVLVLKAPDATIRRSLGLRARPTAVSHAESEKTKCLTSIGNKTLRCNQSRHCIQSSVDNHSQFTTCRPSRL